ncbi:Tip attachment protein J [uncultured Caudovirales phage]|uniref:Tip attachment protein J n=1 Tax=uncultured Caudovirales phage TaxID=2100421 RepID=A0A6J5LHA0_9CAUD|nr:Tip attachment protein J [uncultured Caudovirales phage]
MPGAIIAKAILGVTEGFVFNALAFAINMVASSILAKQFSNDSNLNNTGGDQLNPGSRLQIPPAGDNKIPVIYGAAYTGGTITDVSITSDYQNLYYCLALCEVTNTESGGTPDTITFGNVYWGGKRVVFDGTGYVVASLLDESTGLYDYSVAGKLEFYFYKNGSTNPTNSSFYAYSPQVMGNTNLVYKWDTTKLMSNCAFVIVKIRYSASANLTGIQQTKFQVTNSRYAPGDCFSDYLFSTRYGAAIPTANINSTSLTALNAYCNQTFTYTTYTGGSSTLAQRFRFDGVIDTQQPIMTNLQYMATCCDCLLRYNEITNTWGVIVQSPTYTVALPLDDSNIIGAINVTPLDIASSFNIAEVKFPDSSAQDSFNSATFNLATINPSLLYPNEPVNKQSISLPLVNNDVRAQYIANRFLEACREDLQIQLTIGYVGLQLEAGDIVSITNTNYGWSAKLFRISKVTENYGSDGSITVSLLLTEYNSTVYDDISITQFTPSPNTGLASPLTFGTIPTPSVASNYPNAANPYFIVNTNTSTAGIVDYVELWYSAYASPTTSQRFFAGTTAIASDGNPYSPSTALTVTLADIPAGNWYFFTRMVNGLGSSIYSSPSSVFQWRPTTFTYQDQYLIVAYGDDLVGTNISPSPTGKNYYGLYNSGSNTYSSTAPNYTWYLAQPTFGTTNKLCYINRTGRKFSFGTAPAAYASSTAAYVPVSTFDNSIWSALPDGTNYIDLDIRTGQLTRTGTTSTGSGQIAITNNPDGTMVGSLAQFLNFGGASTYTSSVSQLTIDIYGRVVGVIQPDNFYYTSEDFTATAGQTVFTPTARQAGYITGQDLVFRNGVLLDTTEYTETSTTVTMNTACTVGTYVAIVSMRSVATTATYEDLGLLYSSGTGTTTLTYINLPHQIINVGDKLTFSNTGTPTQYTVSSINYTTKQIVFSGTFTASAGNTVYRYRAINSTYPSFSRWTATLSSASSYTPTTFQLVSGSELLFLNGTVVNDQDYDLVGNTINNFPSTATGNFTIIQFAPNNQGVPNGLPTSTSTFTVNGTPTYIFSYTPNYFEIFGNGAYYRQATDYTTASGSYTLVPTPNNNTTVLVQQTYNAAGVA